MLGSIDKSLSELLKETANKVTLSYIDSKKRIFRERRANGVAPTVDTRGVHPHFWKWDFPVIVVSLQLPIVIRKVATLPISDCCTLGGD